MDRCLADGCGKIIWPWQKRCKSNSLWHKTCHAVSSLSYEQTWQMLNKKYQEYGYPPALLLYGEEYEPLDRYNNRMAELCRYTHPICYEITKDINLSAALVDNDGRGHE